MDSVIVTSLVGLFCSVVTSIITFILTKKKYNTEVEAQQIQNMKDSFEVYKKMMEDAVAAQNKKIEMLQKENDNLRSQLNQLQTQMLNILIGKKLGIDVESSIYSQNL
jgi:uncharacterized membrane protein (DUF106 family)